MGGIGKHPSILLDFPLEPSLIELEVKDSSHEKLLSDSLLLNWKDRDCVVALTVTRHTFIAP